ncbi:unnamed protein product [Alternaria alternata]
MARDEDKRTGMINPATDDDANITVEHGKPTTHTANDDDPGGERASAGNVASNHKNGGKMTLPPPDSSSTPLDLERLHILLTYSTLLALTRDASRPVVDLNMEAQVRQLDAFLAGDVTEDGVAIHWSARSQGAERLWQYEKLCNELVPNLIAAIKKQSQVNLNTEPKNRVNGEKNPEHRSFYELFLTPNLVTMYGKLIEKMRKKDMSMNPDFDPWTDAVKYGKLIQLFKTIYDHQYDFTNWKHTRPEPVFNQTTRWEAEEFMRIMDDRDQIRVYHCIVTPLGKVFSQLDTIPEVATKYSDEQLAKMWRDKTRPKYLIPDPAFVTVPAKQKDMTWANPDDVGKVWTRGNVNWPTIFKFMVFDKATNAYIHDHVIDIDVLDQINLNDETWVNRYRKKISQWRSRATGESTKVRDHWDDEERVLVYQFSNNWVMENGIDKFVPRIWDGEKHSLMAAVNKAGRARTAESVCAWAKRQMTDKPNEPLGLLYAEGQRIATRVGAGEIVPDNERYPDEAIDIASFLPTPQPKKSSILKQPSIDHDQKRKRDSDASDALGELMSDSGNFNLDGDSDQDVDLAMETVDGNFHDVDSPSSPPRPSKRPKLTTKDKKDTRRDNEEQEANFAS